MSFTSLVTTFPSQLVMEDESKIGLSSRLNVNIGKLDEVI